MPVPKSSIFVPDINWFCLYLVFLVIPIIELSGLLTGTPSSVPSGTSIAIELFAVTLTLRGCSKLAFRITTPLQLALLCWFTLTSLGILADLYGTRTTGRVSSTFWISLLPMCTIALLLAGLQKISHAYRHLSSFVAGAGGLLLGALGVHGMLLLTISNLPYVYDPVLYRIQAMLNLNWSQEFAGMFYADNLIHNVLYAIYSYLNIGIILAAAWEFAYAPDKRQAGLFLRFLVVALVGYGLYYTMPALAPAAFFGTLFPWHIPDVASVTDHVVIAPRNPASFDPRNTVPSLHAAWAILALLALRRSPFLHRVLGTLFVAVIFVVTLGSGQHYTVDWIAALPLVLLARGISAVTLDFAIFPRIIAILLGAILLSLWIVTVRNAPSSLNYPDLIKLLALASLILPIVTERNIAKAEMALR